MDSRIQTWFPFRIPIGLNGREWLARQMRNARTVDREGLKYAQTGNCFPWIEDYARAQELMRRQLETKWVELLQGLAQPLNPLNEEIFQNYPTEYYWTCYQSEWATDMVFREPKFLKRLMSLVVEDDLQWQPTPKGIVDLHRRAEISQAVNERLIGALASVDDSRRLEELTDTLQQSVVWKNGRRVRGLPPGTTRICWLPSAMGTF